MIRIAKPVRLLEWGEGTNTTNQTWSIAGEGRIVKSEMRNGLTTLIIDCQGGFSKKNSKDNELKLAQPGEGMTANSPRWGEVAVGEFKAAEGNRVTVVIRTATKIDLRSTLPASEEQANIK